MLVNLPVYLSPVIWVSVRLVYSLLPGVPVCQPCLVLIKDCYFEFNPRLRVPRFSLVCAPWQKTRPNSKRRPFTSFCFWKSFYLFPSVPVCLSRGKEVAARYSHQAHCKSVWEFGGIAKSAASPLVASPSTPRRLWLPQVTPLSAAHPSAFAGDRRPSRLTQARDRGRYPPRPRLSKLAAHSSPPSAGRTSQPADRGSLKSRRHPQLTQARRRSREIDAAVRGSPKPAAVRGSLTSSRPLLSLECMWQACRPPLTQAQVPWIQSTRHGQECRVYVLLCPQEHFNLPCRVLSTETRWGRAGARLVVATEAIPIRLPLLVVEVVAEGPCEGPWLLVMPRRSLSFQASPGGLPVPVGCLVPVCLALCGLSCPVCLALCGLSCHVLSV